MNVTLKFSGTVHWDKAWDLTGENYIIQALTAFSGDWWRRSHETGRCSSHHEEPDKRPLTSLPTSPPPRSCSLLNRAPSSSKASYRLMGNCCGSTATEPSAPPPQVTERMTPAPVISQPSTERSPVSSTQPLSRRRSRTSSRPESTHRSGVSSQDSGPRSRTKSAPQPPQSSSSNPSSPENPRTRALSAAAPKRSQRSYSGPTSPGESGYSELYIINDRFIRALRARGPRADHELP